MDLFAHRVACVGRGGLFCFQRVSSSNGSLHLLEVLHDVLLEFCVNRLDAGLFQLRSIAVGQQVRQCVACAIEGIGPVLRVGVVSALLILVPDALGRLLVRTNDRARRDFVAVCGVGRQQRIVRDECIVHIVVKCSPLDDGRVQVARFADLKEMRLDVVGLGNRLGLEEVEGVFHRELLGQLDVGVDRNDLTVLVDIAHGEILLGVGVLLEGVHTVQIVQASGHAGRLAGAVVGGIQVNDIGLCVAHERASFLCHRDHICRSDHVVGIVKVDLADRSDVRLHEHYAGGKLQCNVFMTSQVLHEPSLVLVGNEHARTTRCTGVIVDGSQQLHAFPRGRCLAEQDGRDLGFLNAVIHIGVHVQHSVHAVQGLGRRDHHALFVRASLFIRRVVVRAVAVGADAQTIVVTAGRITVAVMGKGVSKAIAALVQFTGRVVAGSADVEQLVVIVGSQIFDAAEHRRSVLRVIAADIKRRAGKRRRNHSEHQKQRTDDRSNFLKRHRIDSPFT